MDEQTTGAERTHVLKTWPQPFAAVRDGRKPYEYRFNDRDFQEGDKLVLQEWAPEIGYTGEELHETCGAVLHGGQFGIPAGYCIISLARRAPSPSPDRAEVEREFAWPATDWRCPECRCRSWARFDVRTKDGGFRKGEGIRCVECKREHYPPHWAEFDPKSKGDIRAHMQSWLRDHAEATLGELANEEARAALRAGGSQ